MDTDDDPLFMYVHVHDMDNAVGDHHDTGTTIAGHMYRHALCVMVVEACTSSLRAPDHRVLDHGGPHMQTHNTQYTTKN